MTAHLEEFINAFHSSIGEKRFQRLILSAPTQGTSPEVPRKQTVRPIEIKGQNFLQWELQFEKLQTHQNLSYEESVQKFRNDFGDMFREAYLFTNESEEILRKSKKGLKHTKKKTTSQEPRVSLKHNRAKNYLIPEGVPCPFLEALGIMNATGKVHAARQKKFRQVNRYLEIVNDLYSELPADGPIRIVDFGCGLSYLTFGVHYLLTSIHQREVVLHGIDQKSAVISRCQSLADKLQLEGLEFSNGKIEDAAQQAKVHLALSLHACDSATDAALAYAVNAQADVILAVPCCQHEVFPQIQNDDLNLILKHGILKERIAALATDALRAEALEVKGYKTQIMEFIDLEHTPKNLLIRAVKRAQSPNENSASRYEKLKEMLNIEHLATDQILK